jgi:hypothetical protein
MRKMGGGLEGGPGRRRTDCGWRMEAGGGTREQAVRPAVVAGEGGGLFYLTC